MSKPSKPASPVTAPSPGATGRAGSGEPAGFTAQLAEASWPELEALWQQALAEFLERIGAAEHLAEVTRAVRDHAYTRSLRADWITLPSRAREDRYGRLLELMQTLGYQSRPYCIRCGACCQGASPSLFEEDRRLFDHGLVTREQVYTLRAGERVSLPLDLGSMSLTDEVIKLREDPDTGHCQFYDGDAQACRIYAERPLQCRAQACWDTADIQRVLKRSPKLARAHVVDPSEPVAEALVVHESHCSVVRLAEAFEDAAHGREDGIQGVIEALAYDEQLRPLLSEKLPLPAAELEFYFGRPLEQVIRQFGVQVVRDAEGNRLEPLPSAAYEADEGSARR
jgi:Fe-S-cluster containining protein